MYNLTLEDIIFLMFYASVAILSLMASCYLLFRRANAIAPDVMSPLYNRGTGTLLHFGDTEALGRALRCCNNRGTGTLLHENF